MDPVIGTFLNALLTIATGVAAFIAGRKRQNAITEATVLENYQTLSKQVAELQSARKSDYEEQEKLRKERSIDKERIDILERGLRNLKRQQREWRRGIAKVIDQLVDLGVEPAWRPEPEELEEQNNE